LRALFLLLLLANVLYLAWSHWVAPPAPIPGHATPSAVGKQAIRLLREAPLGQELSTEDPAAAAPAGEPPSLACVSVGPYADEPAAAQAAETLARLGYASRLRQDRGEIRVGYWVRVENLATAEDTSNALAFLRFNGITDAYVVTEDGASVISLGIFGGAAGAEEASRTARRGGLEVRTVERTREADVFWLDVDRQANGGLPAAEDLPASAEGAPAIELRPCPQSAPGVAPSASVP
jgi:hypothetical protein